MIIRSLLSLAKFSAIGILSLHIDMSLQSSGHKAPKA